VDRIREKHAVVMGYHMPIGMWQQVVNHMLATRMPVLIQGHPRYAIIICWLPDSFRSR
jgi:hypothetical protein